MCIIIAGYYGGLIGEEISKIDQSIIAKHFNLSINRLYFSFVPLMMFGRFKRQVDEKKFFQPLAVLTRDGRNLCIWFVRLMNIQSADAVYKGLLFLNVEGKRMFISEMDVLFHKLFRLVQDCIPYTNPDVIKIEEGSSVFRSLRRGAT